MKARMLVDLNEKVKKGDDAPARMAHRLVRVGLAEAVEVSKDLSKDDLQMIAEAQGLEVKPKDTKRTLAKKTKAG